MSVLSWRRLVIVLVLVLAASLASSRHPVAQSAPVDEVSFRIIVVSTQNAAQRLLDRLRAGADFAALARSESIDPSATSGGLIGPVSRAELRPELRGALEQLRPGEISGVARVANGFAVLQLAPNRPTAQGAAIGQNEIPALAATGSVKYTQSVDGFSEANTLLDGIDKPADWNQHPELICDLRKQAIATSERTLERLLGPAGEADRAGEPPLDVVQAYYALGQLYAYDGVMDKAVPQYENAYRVANAGAPDAAPQMEEALGVAYLHKAELESGLYTAPGDRCLLPAAGQDTASKASEAIQNADLQKAIVQFTNYLREQPDDLEVRWLLNVAHMEFGGYPDRVPPPLLVPPGVLDSRARTPHFTDVAAAAGLSSFSSAGGVVIDDFDNDGTLDVLTSNFDSCGVMQLFTRGADGRFVDRAATAGLAGQAGGLNLLQADYNNDGCTDVLVMRGGWELPQRRSLLKNDCRGTFTDVTADAGLAVPATSSQTAVWADFDNDGYLDLFVGNEDRPAQLFHNNGNGTFEDVAEKAGVARTAFTKAVVSADYDNDGYPDFYVTNLGGGNFLYHNNHDGTFTDVAQKAGVSGPDRGFPTWFFDYDNDGWPDLFVTSYYLSVDESARTYLKLPHNAPTLKLYRNLRNGTFADVTAQVGLDRVYMPMGSNFGDIDNDGFLDIYLGTGSPSYAALVPSVLLHNDGGRSFTDVTAASGTGELHKGHGVAFADLDNDGDEDIVFKVGGATPGDAHAMRLFENPGSGNDWLGVKLVGVKSNRSAIGTRVTVTVDSGGAMRSVYRTVGSGGSFGASPLEQHIGLGPGARIASIDVWWPTSGTRQHFTGVAKDQVIQITEGRRDYIRLSRPPRPLARR